MKKSLAKRITIPFLLISFVLTLVITSIGYINLCRQVLAEEKDTLKTNAFTLKTKLEALPVDNMLEAELVKEFKVQADGICTGLGADYISLYEPIEDDRVFYFAIAHREGARVEVQILT